ncbi:class I SAM-dependent methyltransferase [Thiocystis violacea]|uniref:class I SAM-dependent methyltransferase n=1 Tax=Thiocystis violacea TaxID=13725 RepID=UPI0019043CA2|nr:class I SAM-dependent methyltransferase [Thiocystis violacea]MBK1723515.1 hypothetical protein [Thiocystis violacea]
MQALPDVDALIQRVREESSRPDYQVDLIEPLVPLARLATLPKKDAQTLAGCIDDLLAISEPTAFIDQAYRALLRRPADPDGAAHHREMLDHGFGQPFVLSSLRASPEARALGLRFPGFGVAPALYYLSRVGARLGFRSIVRRLNWTYHLWRQMRLGQSHRLRAEVSQKLQEQAHIANELQARVCQMEEDQRAQVERQARALDRISKSTDEQAEQQRGHGQRLDTAVGEIGLLRARVKVLQQRAFDQRPVCPDRTPDDADTALKDRLDAYYLAFEEAHRGQESDIAADQRIYLQDIAKLPDELLTSPMLDIGCGRGEWMRLLTDQGFRAIGVDLNEDMVARARKLGLEVHRSDALHYLARLADNSHAVITGFHVVEHLPFELLFQLVEQAWRVLQPGGRLIFETPNPENVLVGSHTFYHDFSHHHPVTPTGLRFLVDYQGFEDVRLWRLHPYPEQDRLAVDTPLANRVNGHLYGPQDFALLATKPGIPASEDMAVSRSNDA